MDKPTPGDTSDLANPAGLVKPGTIKNLFNRPVLKNPDGSVSTTLSMSFNENGKEVLIPTVVNGKKLSPKDAVDHYRKTGEHLGIFDTPENADAYATALHNEQERRLFQSGQIKTEEGMAEPQQPSMMRNMLDKFQAK